MRCSPFFQPGAGRCFRRSSTNGAPHRKRWTLKRLLRSIAVSKKPLLPRDWRAKRSTHWRRSTVSWCSLPRKLGVLLCFRSAVGFFPGRCSIRVLEFAWLMSNQAQARFSPSHLLWRRSHFRAQPPSRLRRRQKICWSGAWMRLLTNFNPSHLCPATCGQPRLPIIWPCSRAGSTARPAGASGRCFLPMARGFPERPCCDRSRGCSLPRLDWLARKPADSLPCLTAHPHGTLVENSTRKMQKQEL